MKVSNPISPFSPPHQNDANRWRGLRVGLLGGSFNPPHKGHLHIARLAMHKLDLDCVWWIVTPQNPLKNSKDIMPYDTRFMAVQRMLEDHPFQLATHIERDLKTRFTFETVSKLKQSFPCTDFIWICGMDNAHIFHKWDRWQDLLQLVPVVFISRPPAANLVRKTRVRMLETLPHHFISSKCRLDLKKPSINWILGTKMIDISSTRMRKNKAKTGA